MTISRTHWIILASLLAVVLAYLFRHQPPYGLPPRTQPMDTAVVSLGDRQFTVEVARTPSQLQRGLQGRDHLDPDAGMLFVLPQEQVATFWMKGVSMPLDILFFDANARLVRAHTSVPPCTADPCPTYSSDHTARYVLELAAGQGSQASPGDRIGLPPSVLQ